MFRNRFDRIFGKGQIDKVLIEVPQWANQYFHRACKGVRGGWWNTQWNNFFQAYDKVNKVPSREATIAFARKLMKESGVYGMEYVSKNKK